MKKENKCPELIPINKSGPSKLVGQPALHLACDNIFDLEN